LLLILGASIALPNFLNRPTLALGNEGNVELPEEWFTQKLDHFNGQERRTWQQRYFTNSTFYKAGGPIFVQIGGEGAISGAYVQAVEMAVNYGKRYGALMFVLEHRFYGKSKPLPNLSTDNLRFLSSQQALADLDIFIAAIKDKYKIPNAHVITFGGSYPGNLAAWFRLKFPHVSLASVASSAPVRAELDFLQYLEVVDQSLDYITGKECDNRIRTASNTIQTMLKTTDGTRKLEKMFGICKPLNGEKDIATFISNLMGNFMGVVQYDNEGAPITIETVCTIMNNKTMDALTAYVAVSNLFLNGQCLDCSYADAVVALNDLKQDETGVGIRQWTYQTCVEFGYFQTTDSKSQPFGDLVPLAYYTDMCKVAFGFDWLPDINSTNDYYGAQNPKGATNILFVNGSLDPWHALSVVHNIDSTLQAIYITGTAHCANMLPATPKDPPSLAKAQEQIAGHIGMWLRRGA